MSNKPGWNSVPGGGSKARKKHLQEHAARVASHTRHASDGEDVLKYLYDGIPTSLHAPSLSSSLAKGDGSSGSPYPAMDQSRKPSASALKTPEKKSRSPNLKLNTAVHAAPDPPDTPAPMPVMDRDAGSTIGSTVAQTSTPIAGFQVRGHPQSDPPLKRAPLYPYRHPSNSSFSGPVPVYGADYGAASTPHQFQGFNFASEDAIQAHPPPLPPRLELEPSDHSADFSYERTVDANFDDNFYFHVPAGSRQVPAKRTSDTAGAAVAAAAAVSAAPSADRTGDRTHSHSSSVTSATSLNSRKLGRNSRIFQSPHSRQSSLSWAVNSPEEWTPERVQYWLSLYNFNQSWTECFQRNGLDGAAFLGLANYTNLSRYSDQLDFTADSTPSKFIHLLRKTLDRPNSDAARLASPPADSALRSPVDEEEGDQASILSSSDVASVTPSPAAPSFRHNESANDLVPTLSAPNYPTASAKAAFLARGSQESFAQTVQRRKRDKPVARPFSTIEHTSSYHHQPDSPASGVSAGFFKRHTKSNSSESSIFSSLFAADALKGDSPTDSGTSAAGKKSIMSKLRSKVGDRAKPDVRAKTAPRPASRSAQSSPLDVAPSGRIPEPAPAPAAAPAKKAQDDLDQLSPFKFVLDKRFLPKQNRKNEDLYVLVTSDNSSFVPCNVGQCDALPALKEAIADRLGLADPETASFHLTDFGSDAGDALDDTALAKLQSFAFYGGTSKILVRGVPKNASNVTVNDLALSATSTRSSTAHSLDTAGGEGAKYPATPQYLLGVVGNGNPREAPVDYLNFKDSVVQRRKSSLVAGGPKGLQSASASVTASVAASAAASTPASAPANTFRVIRKESVGEIDFDKRRESPFQRSMIIAKRNAPPPPANSDTASRSSSLLRRNDSIKRPAGGSLSSAGSVSGVTVASDDHGKDYLSPFTPGLSTALVPQPYRGSVSPSSRTPVSPRDRSPERSPPQRLDTARIPSMRRDDSLKSFKTIAESDRFNENVISFQGAPSLSDDDSDLGSGDSDDDLWAKVPGKKTSSETLNVVADPDIISGPDRSPDLMEHDNSSQMTVRPPAEVVYDNLEKFFPNTDLDRPIVDETSSPMMSPLPETSPVQAKLPPAAAAATRRPASGSISRRVTSAEDDQLQIPGRHQRMKTIRVVAREAHEARKRLSENANRKAGGLLRRTSTKMWGQKVVEVTPSQLKGGYVSKFKNSKGEFKEFAWVKGELIGKGTFGKVFLALNVTTGEMMAVKQVKVPRRSGAASDAIAEVIDALLSEVETMKDLDHVNIVQYLGFEKAGSIYSLFLEYVAGGSVGSCLRMYGRFEEDLIRFLSLQVLQGLSYLHSRGILHRDLKADNLLLEIDGSCKISDFGISKRSQNIYANDAEMSMQGTIFWMAPEVIDNVVHNKKQGYSAKVDIWSLGCVVLEMFAGRRPWSNVEAIGAIYKLGKTKLAPPIPEDTIPYVSAEGRDFIEKCFIIDPEKRPTAAELLEHPFCKVTAEFAFPETKLGQMIKFNEKTKEKVLRMEGGNAK